jgi:hypothetical protein
MTSTIKVNNIQNQCGANIINENSNTITLGASGDTIALASGASQTGFGREGSVNWQTTIKTSTFTAANGEGYFCNTSGGAFTVNLPSASVGNIVAIKDYAGTFQTNNLTITPNGSDKIDGTNANATISTENAAIVLVFADSTRGWLNVNDSTNVEGAAFVAATGGTILTSGDFKTHVFTGPGTFCVSAGSGPLATVDYLVVGAGGGGGGSEGAGGAGAGGFRASGGTASGCYTVSPLSSSPSPVAGLPVSIQGYPIIVGAGGTAGYPGGCNTGGNGAVSTFSTITSAGGGGGGAGDNCNSASAGSGGSGGGGGSNSPAPKFGAGNTPPVAPPQGNPGGQVSGVPTPNANGSGGGGGAGATGGNGKSPGGGDGGIGSYSAITTSTCYGTPGPVGSVRYYAGGGGSGVYGPGPIGAGGDGGGGDGGRSSPSSNVENGTTNTGGGGGGNGPNPGQSPSEAGGTGGSGIVMIRYKFQ